ncbi:hypothetical protein ACWD5Q_32560 [Streptomyces sp. NPDC002513]
MSADASNVTGVNLRRAPIQWAALDDVLVELHGALDPVQEPAVRRDLPRAALAGGRHGTRRS